MNNQKLSTPLAVRMPCHLREWLKSEAQRSQRSLNKEIVYRLQQSQLQQEAKETTQ